MHVWECTGGLGVGALFCPISLHLGDLPPAEDCGSGHRRTGFTLDPSAHLELPRSLACPSSSGAWGQRSEGGWMNLGPGLVCHPPPNWRPPLPTAGAAAERLAEGAYFGSVSLATAAAGPLRRFFYRC